MTQTPDGSAPQSSFPDEGQVGFDAESAPDELHPEGAGAPVGDTPPAPGATEDGDDRALRGRPPGGDEGHHQRADR